MNTLLNCLPGCLLWLMQINVLLAFAAAGYVACSKRVFARASTLLLSAVVLTAYLKCMQGCVWLQQYGVQNWMMPGDKLLPALVFLGWICREYAMTSTCCWYTVPVMLLFSWAAFAVGKYSLAVILVTWVVAGLLMYFYEWLCCCWPKNKEAVLGMCVAGLGAAVVVCMPSLAKYVWMAVGLLLGISWGWACNMKEVKCKWDDCETWIRLVLAFGGVAFLCALCTMVSMPMSLKVLVGSFLVAYWVTCLMDVVYACKYCVTSSKK